jgi:hypothetical protein
LVLSPTYAFSNIFFLGILYLSAINKEVKLSHALIYALLFFAAMGSKGSSALILIGAFFITFLFSFFYKKKWKGPLLITIVLIVEFIFQYFLQFYPNERATSVFLNANIDPYLLLKSIAFQLMDIRIISLTLFCIVLIRIDKLRVLCYFSISALMWIFLSLQYKAPGVWDKFYFVSYAAIPITVLFVYILFEQLFDQNIFFKYIRYLLLGLFSILMLFSIRNTIYRLVEGMDPIRTSYNMSGEYRLSESEIDLLKFIVINKDKYQYFYLDNTNYNMYQGQLAGTDKKYLDLCYRLTAYGDLRTISPQDVSNWDINLPELITDYNQKRHLILFSEVNSFISNLVTDKDLSIEYENDKFIVYFDGGG